MIKKHPSLTRRRFLQGSAAMSLLAGLELLAPAYARQSTGNTVARHSSTDGTDVFDLQIRRTPVIINGRQANPITLNGSIPGP